MSALTGIALQT